MDARGKIGLLLGTVIGAAIAYLLKFILAGDEERPPIIVRGGSLEFQSGDEDSNNPTHRKGKEWREEIGRPAHWKSDHPKGTPCRAFSVRFPGMHDSTTCPSRSETQEVTIYYLPTKGNETKFTVKLEEESDGSFVPLIVGDLSPRDKGKQNPRLVHDEAGNGSFRVQFTTGSGTVNCPSPRKVRIRPLKK